MVIQVVCWVELPEQRRLCSIFCENMDPDKWDTIVWYRVTRNPQEFRGLIDCQRDPRIWGVTKSNRWFLICYKIEVIYIIVTIVISNVWPNY